MRITAKRQMAMALLALTVCTEIVWSAENLLWVVPSDRLGDRASNRPNHYQDSDRVEVLGWVSPNSWLVRARAVDLVAGPVAGHVAGQGVKRPLPYDQRLKIASALESRLALKPAGPVSLEVVLAPRSEPKHLVATLFKTNPGVKLIGVSPGPPSRVILDVAGSQAKDLVETLSNDRTVSNDVIWIADYQPMRWLNVDSVGPIQANADSGGDPPTATPVWDQDILGSGQIIGVADSGLDRNEGWFSQHHNGSVLNTQITNAEHTTPPIPGALYPQRKVVGYWIMPGASAYDDNEFCSGVQPTNFHGTHVTGTAAGDRGTASRPDAAHYDSGDGMAPQARILFQDIGSDTTGCLSGAGGVPMWTQALAAGVSIHSNSYGSFFTDAYVAREAALDDFLWRNEQMLILFAAGNEGASGISHPGHAKHVLTVGALNHGNSVVPASFSSLGPASDGRIKPDIAAPGVSIQSARGNDNDTNPSPGVTGLFSGTSMATPAVAGAAALVSQYFRDGFYPEGSAAPENSMSASGPLLKATLLNGTLAFSDTPSVDRGWGRVWLDNNLYFPGDDRQLRVWSLPNAAGLSEGDFHEFAVQVPAGQEFRATLVWYDPAPALVSPAALVNDLDLTVTGPDGIFVGNHLVGGVSAPDGARDQINPVEQVRVASPLSGPHTIRVDATHIPGNGELESLRQGYALVVSAGQCDTAVVDPPTFILATDSSGVRANVTGVEGADAFQVYRAPGQCASVNPSEMSFVGTTTASEFDDQTTQGGFSYAYRVRGVDACGEGPSSSCRDVISQAPCTLTPVMTADSVTAEPLDNFCAARISWSPASARCPGAGVGFELHRSSDPFFTPTPATRLARNLRQTSSVDYQVPSGVTHYYRAVAVDDVGNNATPTAIASFAAVGPIMSPGSYSDGGESLALAIIESPWQLTESAAAEGARSYRNASDGLSYSPNICASITTPDIPLQAGAVLSYQARYQVESGWDGVVVEISVDGGLSWAELAPDDGYPGDFSQTGSEPVNACGYPATQGAFNGDTEGAFLPFQSDLSALQGQTIRLRWRFSSDPGLELDGFYLDSVSVSNSGVPSACSAGELLYVNGFE